jgi:uncharacterized HAD superfamily protein/hypoxanthine phosphoribosyltransferase
MNIVSYQDLLDFTCIVLDKISRSRTKIDAVAPSMRSGMIPAFMIAERLNVPIMLDGRAYGGSRIVLDKTKIKNVLVVEDSINTGNSLKKELPKYSDYNVFSCAIIAKSENFKDLNFYGKKIEQPRVFEWNMFNCSSLKEIMFDMDGVICQDPSVFDNDGVEYMNDIEQLNPLYIPGYKIHSIVTNRLERWREVTEKWLIKHNVKYGELVMQQFSTAEERRRKSNTGTYKGNKFKDSNAALFIESSLVQAETISLVSKKPVFSIEQNKFLGKI